MLSTVLYMWHLWVGWKAEFRDKNTGSGFEVGAVVLCRTSGVYALTVGTSSVIFCCLALLTSFWLIKQHELSFQILTTVFLFFCQQGLCLVMGREGHMHNPEASVELLERGMSGDPSNTRKMVMLFLIHNIKSSVIVFSLNKQVPRTLLPDNCS